MEPTLPLLSTNTDPFKDISRVPSFLQETLSISTTAEEDGDRVVVALLLVEETSVEVAVAWAVAEVLKEEIPEVIGWTAIPKLET